MFESLFGRKLTELKFVIIPAENHITLRVVSLVPENRTLCKEVAQDVERAILAEHDLSGGSPRRSSGVRHIPESRLVPNEAYEVQFETVSLPGANSHALAQGRNENIAECWRQALRIAGATVEDPNS